MRRRSRAGASVKSQRRKPAVQRNGRKAKKTRPRNSSAADQKSEAAQLASELAAIKEILQLISNPPCNFAAVLQSVAERAAHICQAQFVDIFLIENNELRDLAWFGEMERTLTIPLSDSTVTGQSICEMRPISIDDLQNAGDELALGREIARRDGHRSILAVPLIRERRAIGAVVIRRTEIRPFEQKHISLLSTFASQAVIAIENTRLLSELRESLEQQTAISEVLKVISSSPGQLEPVFQTILANAVGICEAKFGMLYSYENSKFHPAAEFGVPPALSDFIRQRGTFQAKPASTLDRLMRSKQVIYCTDIAEDATNVAARFGGARTYVAVPMLRESELIGTIIIFRQEVRPFTEKQVALLTNFAAQAVITIENARLLNDLNTLNRQLEQRVTDQVGEIERMGKLRRFLPPQVADLIVASGNEKLLESHRREITALFCDLRGFTGFSESSDPEDVMALLSAYHAAIGEIINKYGGTLERYAGDGVMVVFNDPIPVDNPALQAVLMAIDLRVAIGELIEKWRKLGHDIGFGIGIAHGYATLGTIGFEGRFDYSAIGTVSNVASRLCDEAKAGQILISPRVLMAVEDRVSVEAVGEFVLKGIRRPLAAYNVLATKNTN